ncbi:hypothetical protein CRUP_033326 [Coryphaenoides rupestris]|nr:hypothetical protein CRUP_033326 [Coryphaenoides rupestris]
MALETLRMSMSTGAAPAPDSCHLKLLPPGAVNYLATCLCSPSGGHEVISSRLSRLFSIFVLPALSVEVLFSMHAPRLQLWLKDMPHVPSTVDMACRIISTTKELYHAVCEHFPLTEQRPHFMFSHHDLQKVFWGMSLCCQSLNPNHRLFVSQTGQTRSSQVPTEPLATVLNITRLWMHECLRTFGDRLCSQEERRLLLSLISRLSESYFTCGCTTDDHALQSEDTPTACTVPTEMPLNTGTATLDTASQSLDTQEDSSRPDLSYQGQRLDQLMPQLSATLKEVTADRNEAGDGGIASSHVLHRQRALQLLHILRALLVPAGHGVLLASARATGRKTNVRLAARIAGCPVMEVHRGNEGRLDRVLKEAGRLVGRGGGDVVVLVHQDVSQTLRDRVLLVMARSAGPGLYSGRELANIIPRVTATKEPLRGQIIQQ